MKTETNKRLIRLPEVKQMTGLGKTSIYRKINAKTFPKQIPIGANLVVWLESDIQKWIQEQINYAEGN